MKIRHETHTFARRLSVTAAGLLIALTGATAVRAQGDDNAGASAAGVPAGAVEGSTLGTFADPSSQGNTVQSARVVLGQGMRELKQAQKLEEKAAATDDSEKAAKWLEKSRAANANAIQLLTQALQQNDKLTDGYEALGVDAIRHIHIKDCVVDMPKATVHFREMGTGQMAQYFEPLAAALKRDGYAGGISLESVYRPEGGDFEAGFRASVEKFKQLFG